MIALYFCVCVTLCELGLVLMGGLAAYVGMHFNIANCLRGCYETSVQHLVFVRSHAL